MVTKGKMLYRTSCRFGGWRFSDNGHWYGRRLVKRMGRRREDRFWRRDQDARGES